MKERVVPDDGPPPVGPYSPAIRANGFVFVSGQIPLDPTSGEILRGPIKAQVRRVMENLRIVLESGGSSLQKVVKSTVYLKDLADFEALNETYADYFPGVAPARSTVQAAALPKGVAVEIDVIALA